MRLSSNQYEYIQNEVDTTRCGYEVSINVHCYGTLEAFQCCDGHSRGGSKVYHVFADEAFKYPTLIETTLQDYQPELGQVIKRLFEIGMMEEGSYICLVKWDEENYVYPTLVDDFSIIE